jgi:hypothetical protein
MILGAMSTAASTAQAQVGISSGVAEVSMVARAASRASMPSVGVARRIGGFGTMTEVAVRVHLTANSGYRLVARGSAGTASRVWVQLGDGEYQKLVHGAALTLSHERGGSSEQEVHYLAESTAANVTEMPIRLELVVDPAI